MDPEGVRNKLNGLQHAQKYVQCNLQCDNRFFFSYFESTRVGSVTRVLVVKIQQFSENLEETLHMVCSNLNFGTGIISEKDHGNGKLWPMVFYQKQAKNGPLILTHYLKGLSL